jgi:hypothetical protein
VIDPLTGIRKEYEDNKRLLNLLRRLVFQRVLGAKDFCIQRKDVELIPRLADREAVKAFLKLPLEVVQS